MKCVCKDCNKSFSSEESLKQHNIAKHFSKKSEKINFKKSFIVLSVFLILIFLILSLNNYLSKPGKYDDFAKCLSEKGVVVYGNDYCSYTVQQLNFFGKSKKYLNYIKCANNKVLCDSKGISITPTWEINNKMYSGVQTFKKLSAITGCNV